MRPSALTLASLLLGALQLTACGGRAADRTAPGHPAAFEQAASVSVEQANGVALEQHFQGGATFIAGQSGERYNIRVTNHSAVRIEAVVSVDGRDVISGEVGDFKRQRGYIIAPFDSVVVEGFRQSFEQVAAFRFSDVQASYSSRQGTPQNVGVIGVAIFTEKPPRVARRKNKPIAVGPAQTAPEPFADSRTSKRRNAPGAGGAPASSPPPSADFDAGGEAEAAEAAPSDDAALAPKSSSNRGRADGGFAPAPTPQNELGTEYGESMASSVHEVEFKRRNKRRPDEVITLFYDSPRGLQNRGIALDHDDRFAPEPNAEPFPQSGFAQPPRR